VIGASSSNQAFVFVKDAERVWSLQQELTPSENRGGFFGWAVAVDGDLIIVGAYRASNGVGAAYIFERSGTTWNETTTLTPSDNLASGSFGYYVDVEGDAIVVGAPGRNSSMGAVYVFALNATKVWEETKIVTASDGASGSRDQFGHSVALSGSSFAVGALMANTGKAYVYDGPDFDETKLLQGDATGNDWFGQSVALFGEIPR
jgi:hypothetical protein